MLFFLKSRKKGFVSIIFVSQIFIKRHYIEQARELLSCSTAGLDVKLCFLLKLNKNIILNNKYK
jgi:hypothetical protein